MAPTHVPASAASWAGDSPSTSWRYRIATAMRGLHTFNYVKTANGVDTYRQTLSNGSQVWAEVHNGEITNGGVNAVPRA